jgi:hypothetical protein
MVTHESGGHHHAADRLHPQVYVFSLDHKVIGIQYYFLALFSVFLGMALSLLMRIHLVWPNAEAAVYSRRQMTPEQYLALVTMHGSIMVFMVLTTAPQSGFGNYVLPIQIGAEDMAFPCPQHALLLDHVRFAGGVGFGVLRGGRSAHFGLDRLSAAERDWARSPGRVRERARRCG